MEADNAWRNHAEIPQGGSYSSQTRGDKLASVSSVALAAKRSLNCLYLTFGRVARIEARPEIRFAVSGNVSTRD